MINQENIKYKPGKYAMVYFWFNYDLTVFWLWFDYGNGKCGLYHCGKYGKTMVILA